MNAIAPQVDAGIDRPDAGRSRPEPRYAGDPARPIFTWHHAPPARARRGAAVVLCPPLGHDYLSVYRTWRVLADALSAIGLDVVRLEYDGTGSSAGTNDERDRLAAWTSSVGSAIAHARRLAGSRAVALVGLRAGALLALEAAARDGGVERLVAWNPPSSGRALVRELKAFAALTIERGAAEEADEGAINAAGYVFHRETLDELSAWTLGGLPARPAPHVLVVDHDERPPDARIAEQLQPLGCRVDRVRPPGTAAMLAPPQHALVPGEVVHAIVDWLGTWRQTPRPVGPSAEADAGWRQASGDGWTERPLRFGPEDRLFGLLTTPSDGAPARPSVVVLGTGVQYQGGQHRLYVPLAREWASRGHAVLRFDLGGVGDSLAPPGARDDDDYPPHAVEDARHAVAVLRGAAPGQPVVLVGFCSGGLVALSGALEGLEVAGIACVNAPLHLRDGDVGRTRLRDARELGRYRQSLESPSKWRKAITGRASYLTLAAVAARAVRERGSRALAGRLGLSVPNGLAADVLRLADRGVRAVFAFSPSEEALAYFDAQAAPALRRRAVRRLVTRVVVEGAGHTFRPRAAQRALRALLDAFVAGSTPASPAG